MTPDGRREFRQINALPEKVPEDGATENQELTCASSNRFPLIANDNAGRCAAKNGQPQHGFMALPEIVRRMVSNTVLCHAIRDCEREDAVVILDAALADLSMGAPPPVFISATDDARWWASCATPREVKAFAWACFEAMHPRTRAAFIQYVNERGAA